MSIFKVRKQEKSQTSAAGSAGEDQARVYLETKGMKFVCRNFRCRLGELDLVMQDGGTLVVVEVRMRSSVEYGLAHETVNLKKQQKIIKATKFYQQQASWWGDVRFDVVAVMPGGSSGSNIEHIQDAFGV